jgi:hypothetical protein
MPNRLRDAAELCGVLRVIAGMIALLLGAAGMVPAPWCIGHGYEVRSAGGQPYWVFVATA